VNHLQLAFIIGLFGSLHCVGMCGPLAFALQNENENKWLLVFNKLSYNIGRAVTYSLLGFLIGIAGKQLWLAGFQQAVSIISGSIILFAALPRIFKWQNLINFNYNILSTTINKLIAKALKSKAGNFYVGLLNGLLPCGFVYVALSTAVNTSSATQSALFMFVFGLGTTPLMLAAMLGVHFGKPIIRYQINRLLPWLMVMLGLWFIVRGLNLGIPFLSPLMGNNKAICH
jgi:sulfite exporter TauE/SafE